MLNVWIIEDNIKMADGLSYSINEAGGFCCSATFSSYEACSNYLKKYPDTSMPDVFLMDINLPGLDGKEATRLLKKSYPELSFVMHTLHDDRSTIIESIKAGASAYIVKGSRMDRILMALQEAHDGGMVLPPAIAEEIHFLLNDSKKNDGPSPLSDREHDVLDGMSLGLNRKEIAAKLNIAPSTVDNHMRGIYKKLHVKTGVAAVAKAFREGYV